jgi:heat shock 70kDa protein 1/2/6/8
LGTCWLILECPKIKFLIFQDTKNVVFYDLGGGTFDVSVMNIKYGRSLDVLAVGGDTNIGGVDFDNILVEYCIKKFALGHTIYSSKCDLQRLQITCEEAKITLSLFEEATIYFDGYSLKIERSKFEKMCHELFEKTLECVQRTLDDAKINPAEIDEVFLIGKSTHIPIIRYLLQKKFVDKNITPGTDDMMVAHGAAIQAAILSGAVDNALGQLNDVTPFTLGTEIHIDNADIIRRNTKIPKKITKIYPTEKDYQTKIRIDVYEGGNNFLGDSLLLNELTLQNVTPAKRGQTKVNVEFRLDENGILFVTANEVGNPDTGSIKIETISRRLSKDSIGQMMRDFKNDQSSQFNVESDTCENLRKRIEDYIHERFVHLAGVDNIGDTEIKKSVRKCAEVTYWLNRNPQAQISEIQQHFKELQIFFEAILKPKNAMNNIIYSFNSHYNQSQNQNQYQY